MTATPGIHEHMLAALRRCPALHAEADRYELMMNVDAVFDEPRPTVATVCICGLVPPAICGPCANKTMTVLEDGSGRKSPEVDHQVDQSLNPSTGEADVILPAPPTGSLTEAELDVVLDRAKKGWPE